MTKKGRVFFFFCQQYFISLMGFNFEYNFGIKPNTLIHIRSTRNKDTYKLLQENTWQILGYACRELTLTASTPPPLVPETRKPSDVSLSSEPARNSRIAEHCTQNDEPFTFQRWLLVREAKNHRWYHQRKFKSKGRRSYIRPLFPTPILLNLLQNDVRSPSKLDHLSQRCFTETPI